MFKWKLKSKRNASMRKQVFLAFHNEIAVIMLIWHKIFAQGVILYKNKNKINIFIGHKE